MPTSYTQKLMEQGQSFPEFVMLCARAMGACVTMRDDDLGIPIPDKFEPSSYYPDRLRQAEARLKKLRDMTPPGRLRHGAKLKADKFKEYGAWLDKELLECDRLDAMAKQVARWNPPTDDHSGLKEFMLDQIRISRPDTAYIERLLVDISEKSASEFFDAELDDAISDVTNTRKHMEEDITRTNDRNTWLAQLRDNLKGGAK
jgi:hypothetical protein